MNALLNANCVDPERPVSHPPVPRAISSSHSAPPFPCHRLSRSPRWRRQVPQVLLGGLLGLGCWLGSTGMATANTQVWGGTGQVLSGQGQGATVQLVIEVNDGRIRTQSGPNLDAPFGGGYQSIHTSDGMWQIQQDGEQLSITLHRGDQIIRYQLWPQYRDPNPPARNQPPLSPSSSSSNADAPMAPSGGSQIEPINPGGLVGQPLPSQDGSSQNAIQIRPFPSLSESPSP